MRRFLSAFLALIMAVTMIPVLGLSDGEDPEAAAAEEAAFVEVSDSEPEPEPEPVKEEKQEAPAKEEKKEEPAKEEKQEAPAKEEKKEEPAKEEKQEAPAKEEKKEEPAKEEKQEAPAKEEKQEEPVKEEKQEEPAEEPDNPAEEPEEPAEEPEEPAEEPDKPVEEPEEPAEEPDKPVEEPEEPEEEPVEPAKEPDKPAEEPEGPAEEPEGSEEEPAEDEAKFSRGYALAAKDTKLYTNQYLGTLMGTLDEDTVVYATELSGDETALAVLFAREGEAKEAWLHPDDVTPLTEEETAAYEQEAADVEQGGVLLHNAAITAAEVPDTVGETAVQKAALSTLKDVTAIYQSAAGTITLTLTSEDLPAGGYKITDKVDGSSAAVSSSRITITNKGQKKAYTTTLVISGLKADKEHAIVITPLKSDKKTKDTNGSVVIVRANIVNWAWKTAAPTLINPEQKSSQHVSLSWSGTDLKINGESALGWIVLVDGKSARATVEAGAADGNWTAELDVADGDHTFAVRPKYTMNPNVTVGGQEKAISKTISGTSSKALNYTVDDEFEKKWYNPVEITSAMQTKEKTITVKFQAERPADTYKVYISTEPSSGYTASMKNVTAKVTVDDSGAGTATISGLTEPSSNVMDYYFFLQPVKNGLMVKKDLEGNAIYHTRVWAQTFSWSKLTTGIPTVKVTQSANHTVKMTVTNAVAMTGYDILPYMDSEPVKPEPAEDGSQLWWGKDGSKSTSITIKNVPNGSRAFYAKVRKRVFWALQKSKGGDWEWSSTLGKTVSKGVSKVSETVNLTVADLWSQAPTSVRGAQTAKQGVEIRFNVKALPAADDEIGTIGGGFTVVDITDSSNKIKVLDVKAEDLVYQQNSATSYLVTLALPKQNTGKHIYHIQAYNKDNANTALKGTAVKLTFTVQAGKDFMKSVPNLFSVEQTGEDKVTLKWEPLMTTVKATRYVIYEYDTSAKKVVGSALATMVEKTANQKPDPVTGRTCYTKTISSSAAEDKNGTKHVYVVIPQLKSGSKYTDGKMSNPADGTITVYKPEWLPLTAENVEIDRIETDRKLTFRVKGVKIPAAQYSAKGTNGDQTTEVQIVAYDKTNKTAEFSFENLDKGQWKFTVTARNANGTAGRTFTLDQSKTLIEEPYLMEPLDLRATSTDLGTILIEWTAAAEFPSDLAGSFFIYIDGEQAGNVQAQNGTTAYFVPWEDLSAGEHRIQVVPAVDGETPEDPAIEGIPASCTSDHVYVSRMIPETDRVAAMADGEKTVAYTWVGEKIPAAELKFSAKKGETVTFADTDEGGIMTVKLAEDAGEIEVSHKNSWMEPVVLQAEVISLPTYTLAVTNEGEIFDDEDVILHLSMTGDIPEGATATEAEFIEILNSDELAVLDVETEGDNKKVRLSKGEHRLCARVRIVYLEQPIMVFANEVTVTVTAVDFEENGLLFHVIRPSEQKYEGYFGTLKLMGFAPGRETDSPTVTTTSGRDITVIGEGAFANNATLTSIALPNSVAIIEKQAFFNCENLATMTTY